MSSQGTRSIPEMGALTWLHNNWTKAAAHFEDLDFTSPEGIARFSQKFNVSQQTIHALGSAATFRQSYSPNITQDTIQAPLLGRVPPDNPADCKLLPPVAANWAHIDGSIVASKRYNPITEVNRHWNVWQVSQELAPVAVMVVVGIHLDLGRCCIDQCYPEDIATQSTPSVTLRQILNRDLDELTQQQRERLMTILADDILESKPTAFPSRCVRDWSFVNIFKICATGFPQLMTTTAGALVCGGQLVDYAGADGWPSRISQSAFIQVGAKELEDGKPLQVVFWDMGRKVDTCTDCGGLGNHICRRQYYYPSHVLDRPAPTLAVAFDPSVVFGEPQAAQLEVFHDQQLRYHGPAGMVVAKYRPVGAVFRLSDGTLVTRFIEEYAGTRVELVEKDVVTGQARVMKWWWGHDDAESDVKSTVQMVFYRLSSSNPLSRQQSSDGFLAHRTDGPRNHESGLTGTNNPTRRGWLARFWTGWRGS